VVLVVLVQLEIKQQVVVVLVQMLLVEVTLVEQVCNLVHKEVPLGHKAVQAAVLQEAEVVEQMDQEWGHQPTAHLVAQWVAQGFTDLVLEAAGELQLLR
jgi:hypothetical protein